MRKRLCLSYQIFCMNRFQPHTRALASCEPVWLLKICYLFLDAVSLLTVNLLLCQVMVARYQRCAADRNDGTHNIYHPTPKIWIIQEWGSDHAGRRLCRLPWPDFSCARKLPSQWYGKGCLTCTIMAMPAPCPHHLPSILRRLGSTQMVSWSLWSKQERQLLQFCQRKLTMKKLTRFLSRRKRVLTAGS